MKLGLYLDQHDISIAEFARRLGRSRGIVHDWTTGRRTPRAEALAAIERETGGAVRVSDFMEDAQ